MDSNLDTLCINTIRFLAVDAIQKANSGHPGMPMGAASMAYVLWTRFLCHNPVNPRWPNRDRFVLSAGHGSMLLYALLHLTGYDVSLEQVKNFRQWGSITPGHPEYGLTPGVETTTGPLGQGFAVGVGMAIAERYLAARFNRPGHDVVDHYTYAIVSDGDLMEGVASEAASLAGHLKLGKLVYLYDDNHISIEGSTDLTFTEDRAGRFEAYGWHVQKVSDGNDLNAIEVAIQAARRETDRPSLILIRTHIGYGSPHKQDSPSAHGEPLGEEEVIATKKSLGWPTEPAFHIPPEVLDSFRQAIERGKCWEVEWKDRFAAYSEEFPALADEWRRVISGKLPTGWDKDIPKFDPDPKGVATRAVSGKVLNAVASHIPELIGGSADLAPSNKTLIQDGGDFQAKAFGHRNLRFGVREHAMGAVLNGLALHGGIRPYGGTFLVFSDYMRPSIRLAAMMELPVVYIFTHDSIGLGEDGPTHQPVEHLPALRVIPGLTVIRPADANETAVGFKTALERTDGPVALILSRQSVPTLSRSETASADRLLFGAYILAESSRVPPDVILIASGSEISLVLEAKNRLEEEGIAARVVNMPSWELFESQSQEYRDQVLPPGVPARLAVEAAIPMGWHRWVGAGGDVIGMKRFGASAPYKKLFEEFGFTVEEVVKRAKTLLGH